MSLISSYSKYSQFTHETLLYIQQHPEAKAILHLAMRDGRNSLFTKNCPTRPEILRGSDVLFRWCDSIKNLSPGKRAREKFRDENTATLVKTALQILVTELWCPMSTTVEQLRAAINGGYRNGKGVLTSALKQARFVISELREDLRIPFDELRLPYTPSMIQLPDFNSLPLIKNDDILVKHNSKDSYSISNQINNSIITNSNSTSSLSQSQPQSSFTTPTNSLSQSQLQSKSKSLISSTPSLTVKSSNQVVPDYDNWSKLEFFSHKELTPTSAPFCIPSPLLPSYNHNHNHPPPQSPSSSSLLLLSSSTKNSTSSTSISSTSSTVLNTSQSKNKLSTSPSTISVSSPGIDYNNYINIYSSNSHSNNNNTINSGINSSNNELNSCMINSLVDFKRKIENVTSLTNIPSQAQQPNLISLKFNDSHNNSNNNSNNNNNNNIDNNNNGNNNDDLKDEKDIATLLLLMKDQTNHSSPSSVASTTSPTLSVSIPNTSLIITPTTNTTTFLISNNNHTNNNILNQISDSYRMRSASRSSSFGGKCKRDEFETDINETEDEDNDNDTHNQFINEDYVTCGICQFLESFSSNDNIYESFLYMLIHVGYASHLLKDPKHIDEWISRVLFLMNYELVTNNLPPLYHRSTLLPIQSEKKLIFKFQSIPLSTENNEEQKLEEKEGNRDNDDNDNDDTNKNYQIKYGSYNADDVLFPKSLALNIIEKLKICGELEEFIQPLTSSSPISPLSSSTSKRMRCE